MAAEEVVTALQVLTSDVPLRCEAWPDSGAFEALITDYFAGSDDSEESETSDLILTTTVFPLVSVH